MSGQQYSNRAARGRGRASGGRGRGRGNTKGGDESEAPQREQKPATQGWATVKMVLSGDTIEIMGQAKEYSVAPTKRIQLQYIMCPRAMRSRNGSDEAFGWDALEFTRKLLIGQAVQFSIPEQEVRDNKNIPDHGSIFIRGRNVAEILLENGWAKCKGGRNQEVPEKYRTLQETASEMKIGRWQTVKNDNFMPHIRQCNYDVGSDEVRRIWSEYYGQKNMTVNINKVLTGSTLLCELTSQKDDVAHKSDMIRCHLAGVNCPETLLPFNLRKKYWEDRGKRSGEPEPKIEDSVAWAEEARNYSEIRLLNRDVELELVTKDTNSRNVYVNIVIPAYPQRNISLSLLSTGLAKIQKWSKNALPAEQGRQYERAENHAKQNRLTQWREYKAPLAGPDPAAKDFTARVVQIVSGDCIVAQPEGSTEEERYTLASLRTPRMRRGGAYSSEGEPWSDQAREYLRGKLIGRKVRIVKEYSREPRADSRYKDAQQFVSVHFKGKCLNVELVKEGFADVIPHRRDDERAERYSEMSIALDKAKESKTRRWGSTPPQTPPIEDLSVRFGRAPARGADPRGAERTRVVAANQNFMESNKGKKISAVVEYCFSGGRFKVFVPETNQMLIFLLGGLRTPSYSNRPSNDRPNEPWGKEGYALARDKILQRSITIIPEGCDRGGNVIGQVLYNNKSQNLGEDLLRKGLAKINFYSARESRDYGEKLIAADQLAKDEKLRIYLDYDADEERAKSTARWRERNPEAAARQDAAEAGGGAGEGGDSGRGRGRGPRGRGGRGRGGGNDRRGGGGRGARLQGQVKQVYVTHVIDASSFCVNFMDSPDGEKLTVAMQQLEPTDDNQVSEDVDPKELRYRVYGGLFDNGYYRVQRAKGGKPNDDGTYSFKFIDFGNEDDLAVSDLVTLPDSLAKIPPLARECSFAGLRAPDASSEWFNTCGEATAEAILNKNLECRILVENRGALEVELLESTGRSVGIELCKQGNMTLPARMPGMISKNKKYVAALNGAVDVAKSRRLKMWRYGDPGDGSDDAKKEREREMKGVDVSKIVRTRDGRLKQAL